jgi:malonate-semialdehyde dehydrogenase (acetylating)/methylmalonate-semialdehyde dehydrogenase
MKYAPLQNYINGQFVASSSARKLAVISPIDGNHLSEVPMSTAKDLDAGVKQLKRPSRVGVKHP